LRCLIASSRLLWRALGSGADAVIDTVAYTADDADRLLEIEPSVGSFVVISSSSVDCDPAGRTPDEARKSGLPDFSAEDALLERRPTSAFAAKTT
jgi:hypothetical protein